MDKIKLRNTCLFVLLFFILVSMWGFKEKHYLGQGFTYFEDPSSISYWRFGDTLHFNIPPEVLSYKNTSSVLLVKHHPREYPHLEDTPYTYPYGRDTVYYFYINKKSKKVSGPLIYSEMETFLKDENITDMLRQLK